MSKSRYLLSLVVFCSLNACPHVYASESPYFQQLQEMLARYVNVEGNVSKTLVSTLELNGGLLIYVVDHPGTKSDYRYELDLTSAEQAQVTWSKGNNNVDSSFISFNCRLTKTCVTAFNRFAPEGRKTDSLAFKTSRISPRDVFEELGFDCSGTEDQWWIDQKFNHMVVCPRKR